jgi:hypothetical protein
MASVKCERTPAQDMLAMHRDAHRTAIALTDVLNIPNRLIEFFDVSDARARRSHFPR